MTTSIHYWFACLCPNRTGGRRPDHGITAFMAVSSSELRIPRDSRFRCFYYTIPDPCIPETEKERSHLDYPQEWITPTPSRRPDIFPEFDRLKPPLPKPMPGDPQLPDEEEEERIKKDPPHEEEDEKKPEETKIGDAHH